MLLSSKPSLTPMLCILFLALAVSSCGGSNTQDDVTLSTDRDRSSYSVGVNIGNNFKTSYVDVDPDIVARGIRDVLEGREFLMTEQEMLEAMNTLQVAIQDQYQGILDENQRAATDFIVNNAAREGVITLPDSLQYEVLSEGSGTIPAVDDTVRVNYHGTLIDGTVFDSSVNRGEPVEFCVDQVIPGWTEILQIMPVGSKWRVYIPPELAYGVSPTATIPPNSLLIFEVELLDVIKPADG
ncbi:FKBP-type peptidyl-prolyl cis-trans isomerase [Candidatus Latescibacterota bacterium]